MNWNLVEILFPVGIWKCQILEPCIQTDQTYEISVMGAGLWLASPSLAFNPIGHWLTIWYGSHQTQTLNQASQPCWISQSGQMEYR